MFGHAQAHRRSRLETDGHWVAELECRDGQHVRHRPPRRNCRWVTTPEGRASVLGASRDVARVMRAHRRIDRSEGSRAHFAAKLPETIAIPPSDPVSTSPGNATSMERGTIWAALQLVASLLVPGESVSAYAVERRIPYACASAHGGGGPQRPLMVLERHVFGGYTLHDIRWQDMKQAQLGAGPFAADFLLSAFAQPISPRPASCARCRSGFAPAGRARPPIPKLSEAKEMLEKGLVSNAEYESLKPHRQLDVAAVIVHSQPPHISRA